MANRPIFTCIDEPPFFEERNVEFQYFSGFAESQKKRSVASLHQAAQGQYSNMRILEISSYSDEVIGQLASAFNLRIKYDGNMPTVEAVFQSSKVFEKGGPYLDLLYENPHRIKKDARLKESGRLVGFRFSDKDFPLSPKTLFYDWLYINALNQNPSVAKELAEYNAFTDIVFNPMKSLNCQARSAAVFVSLIKFELLNNALQSVDDFARVVYPNTRKEF